MADSPEFVTLTRLNAEDRSIVATPVNLPAVGYDVGSLAVDSHGAVWMGWGQTLARYDPGSEATRSWKLPQYSGLARLYSEDGRMVALTIDGTGEIWVAASMVSGLFGFNPLTSSWDRTVNLKFVPIMGSTLGVPRAGLVTINGVTLDANFTTVFAVITTASRVVTMLPAHARNYVVMGSDQIIYSDDAHKVARMSLADGSSTAIATGVPLGGSPSAEFTIDSNGHLWFELSAYRSLGVAELNLTTGAITRFNFPYIVDPGGPGPGNHCPTGAFHCIPENAVANPGIEAIVLDQRDNVWVVTQSPGSDDANMRAPITPIIELQTSA